MRTALRLFFLTLILLVPLVSGATSDYYPPRGSWQRAAPQAVGMDADIVDEARLNVAACMNRPVAGRGDDAPADAEISAGLDRGIFDTGAHADLAIGTDLEPRPDPTPDDEHTIHGQIAG